jgi:hypothetical protein
LIGNRILAVLRNSAQNIHWRLSVKVLQRICGLDNSAAALRPATLLTGGAYPIGQDCARDDTKEMVGARRKRILVVEPCSRSDQCEKVGAVDVGAGDTRSLSPG